MQMKKHVNVQGSPSTTADPNLFEPRISIANFIQEAVVRHAVVIAAPIMIV
jgi:hypothetical protein